MSHRITTAAGIASLALLSTAGAASAHAHVVRSDPATGAVAHASPKAIRITFSEPVMMAFTGIEVKDLAGHTVQIGKPMLQDAGRTLAVPLTSALGPGAYAVHWHAVAADTHRSIGQIGFRVQP